jgi:phage recombination protein Bet
MNELQVQDQKIVEFKKHDEFFGFTQQEISIIKGTMNFNMSDTDLKVFLHVCRHTNLDPLSKQIYAIPRGGKMTIQTSIDGFRLIADRTGKYAPGRPTQYHYDENGNIFAATAFVKKFVGGEWHEIGEQAFMCEYAGNNSFWKKMPSVMISKVAEARALRRAFPSDLSGLYTSDEMDQSNMVKKEEKTEEKQEPVISSETYEALNAFVNGHDELRYKLKKLCKVNDLKDIKESQIESCREFARSYVEKICNTKQIEKQNSTK